MECQEKVGFLTIKRCRKITDKTCFECKKPTCNKHLHRVLKKELGKKKESFLCRECYRRHAPSTTQPDTTDYDYTPIDMDTGSDRFSSSDYQSFDGGESGGAGARRSFAEGGQSGGTSTPLAGARGGSEEEGLLAAGAILGQEPLAEEGTDSPFEGS